MLLTFGLLAAVGIALATISIGFVDSLPGTEQKYHYPNRHPLRWMALRLCFLLSIAAAVTGLVLLWYQKYSEQDASRHDGDQL